MSAPTFRVCDFSPKQDPSTDAIIGVNISVRAYTMTAGWAGAVSGKLNAQDEYGGGYSFGVQEKEGEKWVNYYGPKVAGAEAPQVSDDDEIPF